MSLFALAVAVAALALGVIRTGGGNAVMPAAKKETPDERVFRTGVIRCGYVVYPPYIIKDPVTRQMSGIYYDYTNRIAEMAGLKVDWSYETNYTTYTEDQLSGRFDVDCGGLWPDVNQAKALDYSIPTNYSGIGVYVKADDTRFDGKPEALDDPQYKFAAIDADTSQILKRMNFPKAAEVGMPNITDITMLAETVKAGKADAAIMGEVVANAYMEANPGVLKNVYQGQPIRVYANVWAFTPDSPRLRAMFDTAIRELLYSGVIDKITAQYAKKPNDFYPVAVPYAPVKAE
jgi:ABC-type amino acid transport substrate-binding protein